MTELAELHARLAALRPGTKVRLTEHGGFDWMPAGSGWSARRHLPSDRELPPTVRLYVVRGVTRQTFPPFADQLIVAEPGRRVRRHLAFAGILDVEVAR